MDEQADDYASAIGNAAFVLALRERGVRGTAVLRAMERVPRERFAPERFRDYARRDIALPLPCGQTMTAPSEIAAMLDLLDVQPGARVLEIGTGSGYVTALLAQLCGGRLRSLERSAALARMASAALASEAAVAIADGLDPAAIGPETYTHILVNGAVPDLPAHLCAALAPGGRLVWAHAAGDGTRLATVERALDGGLSREIGRPLRVTPLTPGRAYH